MRERLPASSEAAGVGGDGGQISQEETPETTRNLQRRQTQLTGSLGAGGGCGGISEKRMGTQMPCFPGETLAQREQDGGAH